MRPLPLIALAVLCFGCSKAPKQAPVANTEPEPGIETPEERIARLLESSDSAAPEEVMAIAKPGEKGWKPTRAALGDLGKRMDEKARETKNAKCEAFLAYEDPTVGTMNFNKQEIKVRSDKAFYIEYVMPGTGHQINRLVGDGSKRMLHDGDKWSSLPPYSARATSATAEIVQDWPRDFPELMFAHYKDGTDVWGRLFDGWSKGVGGYKASVEEQTFKQGGKDVRHYRVLAKKDGDLPTEVEVIVDPVHLRPVTMRVRGTLANGEEYRMMWTGRWLAGGSFEDSEFLLPESLPKSSGA